ncbi:aspartyl-phosphate phosphatase Spo0E family protein [Orenia marismortui]|uniref:aspartyl-phosphate phosphatase Spo0E family protein n=1 Tax=Orenia marismortui TaxID=46469 RepID=UPI0014170F2B
MNTSYISLLKSQINCLRNHMNIMITEENGNLLSNRVQEISQTLDQKILEYMSVNN